MNKINIHLKRLLFFLGGFSTINIHCNAISGVKDNGNNTDILYTFTLAEPPGYLINIIPTNILYQNVTKDRIEYIEFHIKDEHGNQLISMVMFYFTFDIGLVIAIDIDFDLVIVIVLDLVIDLDLVIVIDLDLVILIDTDLDLVIDLIINIIKL